MSNLSLNNALVVKNVSKTVSSPEGKLTILSNIDFIVTKGESVAIVGASGAGKSTLLGLMAGLDTTSKGKIFLTSEPVTIFPPVLLKEATRSFLLKLQILKKKMQLLLISKSKCKRIEALRS